MTRNKGKSICIFSTKGGAGKTITALNIAGIFSRLEKKVLLVDLDTTAGAVCTYLNIIPERTVYNLVDDYLNHRFGSIDKYVSKVNDFVDVLACPKDPRQGSKIAPGYVELILEKATSSYEYVIIDTNHTLNEFNLTILDNSDMSLLVLTNDLLDLKNMRNLLMIFKDIGKTNYKILLNGAVNPYKKYFSLYDIKSMIVGNIDYRIEPTFFIKTIDNYIMDGKILTLEEKMPKYYPKAYSTYMTLCKDLMEEEDEK